MFMYKIKNNNIFHLAIVFISVLIIALPFAGCASKSSTISSETNKTIVCQTFSEYDWTRNIVGNSQNITIKLLLDTKTDLHNYQPTAEDLVNIKNCDLFIYTGGESSESWIEKVQKNIGTDGTILNLSETIKNNLLEEELVEGMQEEEQKHDNEDGDDHEHEDSEVEYDEHIWLSVRNAIQLVPIIEDAIIKLDESNKETYEKNTQEYIKKLTELEKEFSTQLEQLTSKTIIVPDRFPFRYLVNDYNLNYYAAFMGCSAETECSFETIQFLANKVKECDVKSVFILENSSSDIAQTVVSASEKNVSILTLNSLQSIDREAIKNGADYIDIMRNNLTTILEGLK